MQTPTIVKRAVSKSLASHKYEDGKPCAFSLNESVKKLCTLSNDAFLFL
jgi:hypothetical protein